jgi:hypothetical protein
MTYNVDEGTDYIEVAQATNTTEFLIGVGKTISQVRATNPPARMEALARQVIAASPALVSLQELDQWFTGSFDPTTQTCGPVALEFDLLQELLSSLAAQGASYTVAVQARQFAIPPTPGLILPNTFLCVQVVNHVANSGAHRSRPVKVPVDQRAIYTICQWENNREYRGIRANRRPSHRKISRYSNSLGANSLRTLNREFSEA